MVVFRVHLLFGGSNVQYEKNKLSHYLLLSGEKLQDLRLCATQGALKVICFIHYLNFITQDYFSKSSVLILIRGKCFY